MSPIEHHEGYLVATCGETFNLQVMLEVINQIAEACKQKDYRKVLIDLRNVKGEIGTMDRYDLGTEVAKLIRSSIKIAVVYRPEEIDSFGENVGVNRGAKLKVFSETEPALKWLGTQ